MIVFDRYVIWNKISDESLRLFTTLLIHCNIFESVYIYGGFQFKRFDKSYCFEKLCLGQFNRFFNANQIIFGEILRESNIAKSRELLSREVITNSYVLKFVAVVW